MIMAGEGAIIGALEHAQTSSFNGLQDNDRTRSGAVLDTLHDLPRRAKDS